MPARIAARGSWPGRGLPPRRTVPASYVSTPKTARAISLRPAPTRPARPTISPARTVKEMSWKVPATGQAVDLEHDVADLGRGLGEEVADLAADHPRDDLVDGGLGDGVGGDVLAVAHHGDGVAEGEDLVEAVGDEDQGAALVAQAAGDREQPVDLDAAERRGRLVHDQQAGVERDRLGDLDDLLVGDGEARGPGGAGRSRTPSRAKSASASAYIAARSMRPPRRCGWRPMKMFSVTDRSGKSVGSW